MAFLVALALPGANALAAEPPPSSSALPTLEVELDPTIPDAEELAEWILDQSTTTLAQLDPAPTHRGTIRVSVAGTLYDYSVSITTIPDGATEETTSTWSCECTNDELLARIRTNVEAAATQLEGTATATTPGQDDSTEPAPARRGLLRDLRWSNLALEGKIGVGLLAAGGVATISGIVLLGVGKRAKEPDPMDWGMREERNYRVPGVPTFVVGAAWLVAGATLIVLDRRRAPDRERLGRARPVPFATRHGVHIGVTGRF